MCPVIDFVEETGSRVGGLLAEHALDHARLGGVAERRRGAVGVDVAELGRARCRPRRGPSACSAPGSRRSDRARSRGGRRTTGRSRSPRRRSARRGPARARAPPSTRIVEPSPTTKPSRSRSNGLTRPSGSSFAHRDRAHREEAADAELRDRGLGAADDHRVAAAIADVRGGVADRHRGGRAGRARGRSGAAGAELHRDHPRRHVRDQHRDPHRAQAIGALAEQVLLGDVQRLQPADAGRDRRADAVRLGCAETSSFASAQASRAAATAICTKRSVRRAVRRSSPTSGSKSLTWQPNCTGRWSRLDVDQLGGATAARDDPCEARLAIEPERGDHADAGDDDASIRCCSQRHRRITSPTRRRHRAPHPSRTTMRPRRGSERHERHLRTRRGARAASDRGFPVGAPRAGRP